MYLQNETKRLLTSIGLTDDQIDNIESNEQFQQADKRVRGLIDYYEHVDFKDNYRFCLLQDTHGSIDRIIEILKNKHNITVDRKKANQILDFISDNMEDFERPMRNYWVGEGCIDSVDFGEQEEQMEGLMNEDFPYQILIAAFEANDFCVNYPDNGKLPQYAYYDLSGEGIAIVLKFEKIAHLLESVNQ